MTEVIFVVLVSLAVVALVALAVSIIAFLVQTSRHKTSRRWAVAAGASLDMVLAFGALSNAVSADQPGQRDRR